MEIGGETSIAFKVGSPMGMELGHVTLEVKGVTKGGQSSKLGVVPGWRVLRVGEVDVFSFDEFLENVGKMKSSGVKTVNIVFDQPDLNIVALNKDVSTFRESVFTEEDTTNTSQFNVAGFLQKKGTNRMSPWQSRYFVAQGHYLKYYKSEEVAGKRDFCLAAIDLDLCEVKDAVGKCFDLVLLESEVTSLKANSDDEAKKWVTAIRTLRGHTFQTVEEEDEADIEEDEGPDMAMAVSYSSLVPPSVSYDSLIASEGTPAPQSSGGAASLPPVAPSMATPAAANQKPLSGGGTASIAPVVAPDKTLTADELQELAWEMAEKDEKEALQKQSLETSEKRATMLANMAQENMTQSLQSVDLAGSGSGGGGGGVVPLVGGPLPDRAQLSNKPLAEELKRQEVPLHLQPAAGEVNTMTNQPLRTAPVGQERKVSRRRSVTSKKCRADMMGAAPCSNFHFRDSPFCHDHASLDPSSVRVSAGGTSELEDTLNKSLEIALDHSPAYPLEAVRIGEVIKSTLPEKLAVEFSDPIECYQLQKQFNALLSFSGDTGDGLLQAREVLSCAQHIGDHLDPEKVNMDWANTLVAGVLGRDDNSPGEEGVDLVHFMEAIRQMRQSMGVDARSLTRLVRQLKNETDDEDSDDDEDEGIRWNYPVVIPENASTGTVLTVPLPGGEIAFAPIEGGKGPGDVVTVPMTGDAVAACVKQAVQEASSGKSHIPTQAEEGAEAATPSLARRASSTFEGTPLEPGIGHEYAAVKGRQRFCLNAFLALREASALAVDLPPMQGWMLKRGDAMSMGYLNSWKLRYFRLEGGELVYYDKEPGEANATSAFQVKKEGVAGSVHEVEARAKAEGREATDKELTAALVAEQNDEVFKDKSCKGAINMGEIVDIQFSIKTAVSVSAAKMFVGKNAPGSEGEGMSGDKKGAELADGMVVFKVTSAKMRRYVLAVPYDQVVPVMALFAKHVHYARASLRFRREYGSGVRQGLTLGERIQWAASTHGAKIVLAGMLILYSNKYLRDNVLNYTLYTIGPLEITPARIVTAMVVTKTAVDIYVANKYANREKKYGVKWQYKKDVFDCCLCFTKFPTIAMRKEHQKHHCRMCGRVVCHACASTMLYYEASGKRQRTCDFCIGNNGPPESCKADASNQKSVFQLAVEAKKKADEEKKSGSASYESVIEKNKNRVSAHAMWTDWGIVPNSATSVSGKKDIPSVDKMKFDFSIFLPADAQAGDTIEVTLPDGVNKVLTYVEITKQAGRQKVSLGFGKDGVFFVLPPKGGHDLELLEQAKTRHKANAGEMLLNAANTAKQAMDAVNQAKDIANMVGIKPF